MLTATRWRWGRDRAAFTAVRGLPLACLLHLLACSPHMQPVLGFRPSDFRASVRRWLEACCCVTAAHLVPCISLTIVLLLCYVIIMVKDLLCVSLLNHHPCRHLQESSSLLVFALPNEPHPPPGHLHLLPTHGHPLPAAPQRTGPAQGPGVPGLRPLQPAARPGE